MDKTNAFTVYNIAENAESRGIEGVKAVIIRVAAVRIGSKNEPKVQRKTIHNVRNEENWVIHN